MKPVQLIIIGAGSRGTGYALYASEHPDRAQIVGVAEPRKEWRESLARTHGIPAANVARDWRELAGRPKFADAAIVATQDALHLEPAVALAEKGYHVLLEKPIAPSAEDCRTIVDAVTGAGVIFAVCHVLRYTSYTKKIKELVTGGVIGDVVSIQRLEPVGYWHQAHSYVRGNWRREDQSSPMLLAKCCHDLDWIRYVLDSPCRSVQSFGTLKHFRAAEKPKGAAPGCLDCAVEAQCSYSAKKIYLGRVTRGETGWPVDVLVRDVNETSIEEALRTGPYGRCVYDCDNDVVDNQVVNMLFEGGRTASLTMTAFTEARHRNTRIFGTRGEIEGDGKTIKHFDFLTDAWTTIETDTPLHPALIGHGGGDYGLIHTFVEAVMREDQGLILSGPQESLETHLMVFAAEKSRRENRVVSMDEMPV